MTGAELDIVVLNWRTPEMSVECAEAALAAQPDSALYLVDNGSGDGSPAHMRKGVPRATVVENESNLGFGAGMNAGVRAGHRPYVLILNSDARPVGDAFRLLVEHCASDPRIGAVGPMTVDRALVPVPQLSPEPPAWKLVIRALPWAWRMVAGPPFIPDAAKPGPIDWLPTLCAAVFRREAFEQVGGFDPGYFLGWEEWDITRRFHEKGWTIAVQPNANVVHFGRGSTPGDLGGWRSKQSRRALCYHLRKYHGPLWYTLGRAACGLAEARLRTAELRGRLRAAGGA